MLTAHTRMQTLLTWTLTGLIRMLAVLARTLNVLSWTLTVPLQMRHVEQIDPKDKSNGWKTLPKFPRDAGRPWGKVYEGEAGHVVFGHHARRRLQVPSLLSHKQGCSAPSQRRHQGHQIPAGHFPGNM